MKLLCEQDMIKSSYEFENECNTMYCGVRVVI